MTTLWILTELGLCILLGKGGRRGREEEGKRGRFIFFVSVLFFFLSFYLFYFIIIIIITIIIICNYYYYYYLQLLLFFAFIIILCNYYYSLQLFFAIISEIIRKHPMAFECNPEEEEGGEGEWVEKVIEMLLRRMNDDSYLVFILIIFQKF